jgi:hypothetical protein
VTQSLLKDRHKLFNNYLKLVAESRSTVCFVLDVWKLSQEFKGSLVTSFSETICSLGVTFVNVITVVGVHMISNSP